MILRRHVLVLVDDEPQVLFALRRELRREGWEVLSTDYPGQALEWLGTRDVSLVLSDQRMPVMSGTDLLAEVRRRSPTTARVLLTAYADAAAEPGLRSCVDALISKPWDPEMLASSVRDLLRDRELRECEDGMAAN